MELENLKSAARAITMPEEMKHRIINNCRTQLIHSGKETVMKTNQKKTMFRKPAAALAALVILLSLAVTAVAAPGILKGQFRDIKDWRGAVVGTAYDQATNEIAVSVTVNGNVLTVHAAIADPRMAPYVYAERMGIAQYRIESEKGKTVQKGSADPVETANGTAAITIPLDGLESGSYNLILTAFYISENKGDQPLNIYGNWECTFTK